MFLSRKGWFIGLVKFMARGATLASRVVVDYHNAPQVRQAMLWIMVQAGRHDVGIAIPRGKLFSSVVFLRCLRIPLPGLSV